MAEHSLARSPEWSASPQLPAPSSTPLLDFAKRLGCTSTSCCVADTICLPLDFLKTRLQLQNELKSANAPRLSAGEMVARIYRTEGVLAFYSGVVPAMLRQVSYGGLCFASYPPMRDFFTAAVARPDATHPPLWARIAAGAISGSAASVLANPTDVVKVRLQADGRLRALGQPARYKGTFDAFRTILGAEGPSAFWNGSLPNMQRAAVVNGAGIAAYDHSKASAARLLGYEEETAGSRFVAALIGGLTTAVVGCPFDVLKTRMMNQHAAAPIYRSLGHCFGSIVMIEGPLALWKGFLPVYMRQAPFNMLNFMIMEQLTKAFLGTTM